MGKKEEAWASKVGLVMFLAIEWKEPDHDVLSPQSSFSSLTIMIVICVDL
jgi:hypothetical protein